ncbi:MAG TPA: DUF3303 family protein [Burkholderiales bacterium]|nr:DUF3303 family protein [Burkholderiales bacterium]
MKFMMTFEWAPDTRTRGEAIARFRATGGLPPKGAKLLGRWTRADFSGGYGLIDTEDPQALAEFALQWSDLMQLRILPVLEDGALSEVLERTSK